MNINIVEVISREKIKPSIPTPDHLRHFSFSFVDQISPSFYIPLIYFYKLDEKLRKNVIYRDLKVSLSKVLTQYYPLAGCLKNNSVDCNDEGVLFLEAQVSCKLSQIIQEQNPRQVNEFLPQDNEQNGVRNSVLAIQVNFFECGNVAIGARISHKIADASSFITFIKNWATTARDERAKFSPEFSSAKLFPPRDLDASATITLPSEKNLVLKRFAFSGSVIAVLQQKYADHGIHPTRVEALSSFIWSRFVFSTQIKLGPEKLYKLVHAVNLRKRMDPPQVDDSFGNIAGPTTTIVTEDIGEDCYSLVKKFRQSISKINKDYAKKLQDGVFEHFGLLESDMKDQRFNSREVVHFYYTSLCRFPIYEANFGWGRPLWVAWGGFPFSNVAVLMDTKCGNGIEVWMHLKEKDMEKFEADKELLSYVSPNLMMGQSDSGIRF